MQTDIRRRILLSVTAGLVAIPCLLLIVDLSQVSRLRQAASTVRIGDSRTEVADVLGVSPVTYTTGFPPRGGAPTIWGYCYGGILNSMRSRFDSRVFSVCNDSLRRLYSRTSAQPVTSWAVRIEFDQGGKVVAVHGRK